MSYKPRDKGNLRPFNTPQTDVLPEKPAEQKQAKSKSPDYYMESFPSKRRTVNISTEDMSTATSTVYPIVGERAKEFTFQPSQNKVLNNRPSPFSGPFFDMANAAGSNLAPRFDVVGGIINKQYLGLHQWNVALVAKFESVMDERNSLIGSYQYYNLRINDYVLDSAYGDINFKSAINFMCVCYQVALRRLAKDCINYEQLILYMDELKKFEFNRNYPQIVRAQAEIMRSANRGPMRALTAILSNEYMDIENFDFELTPYLIPSKMTTGMDEPLIQFNVLEDIPYGAFKSSDTATSSTNPRELFTVNANFTIPHLLSRIRNGQLGLWVTEMTGWISDLTAAYTSFSSVFANLRSALETYNRSNLLTWRRGFDAKAAAAKSSFVNWGLIQDTISLSYESLWYGTSVVSDVVDPVTQMLNVRTIWSDTYGISEFVRTESCYPFIPKIMATTTALHQTQYAWSFISGITLIVINRDGYALGVDRINSPPGDNTGLSFAPMRLSTNGVYDTAGVCVPRMSVINVPPTDQGTVVEASRIFSKLFHCGGQLFSEGLIPYISTDYVMPVPLQIYSPTASIDRYFRQNCVYVQFE